MDKLTGAGRTTRLQSNFKYTATKKGISNIKEQIRDIDATINHKKQLRDKSVNSLIPDIDRFHITMNTNPVKHTPLKTATPPSEDVNEPNDTLGETTSENNTLQIDDNAGAVGGDPKTNQIKPNIPNPKDTEQDNNLKLQDLSNKPSIPSAFDKLFQKHTFNQRFVDNDEDRFQPKSRSRPYSSNTIFLLEKIRNRIQLKSNQTKFTMSQNTQLILIYQNR